MEERREEIDVAGHRQEKREANETRKNVATVHGSVEPAKQHHLA